MSYCLNPLCQKVQNLDGVTLCQSCGATLRLQNRYTALKPIGQGGFGRTFLAVDEGELHEPCCVIKQFFPSQRGTNNFEKASELFRQEALRLEELGKHPKVPDLLIYVEQEGYQYLVQEFIDGINLSEELEIEGAFNEAKIRQLLTDLLLVLQFVHRNQVIHRDIKPANVIRRSADQELFLVDFGAAKYASGTALANTGTVIGSAEYTAPEQARGKAVFASDLYSLGATCIHLLTEMSPFDLYDSSEGQWVWQDYLRQPISPCLDRILHKMLQSATKRRYQSATEVLADLHASVQPTGEGRSPTAVSVRHQPKKEARPPLELGRREGWAVGNLNLNFEPEGALVHPTKKYPASHPSKASKHSSVKLQPTSVEKGANPANLAIVTTLFLLLVGSAITFTFSRSDPIPPATTSTPPSPPARDRFAAEAIQSLRMMNQAQADYFSENSRFSSNFMTLDSVISGESEHYVYGIVTSVDPPNERELVMFDQGVVTIAAAKRPELYSYTSYTSLISGAPSADDQWETVEISSFVCETNQPSLTPPDPLWTIQSPEDLKCPVGSREVSRDDFSIPPRPYSFNR
jgi:serine/threonine protein kinase